MKLSALAGQAVVGKPALEQRQHYFLAAKGCPVFDYLFFSKDYNGLMVGKTRLDSAVYERAELRE